MNENRVRPRALVIVGYVLLAAAVIAGSWVLWRCVPFDLPSYSAWTGVILALVALGSVIRPQRWLGIATRARASLLLVVGIGLAAAGAMWPSAIQRSARERHRIDAYLPEYQFAEYHEARTRAPIDRVIEATRNVSMTDIPTARVLMALRRLADGHVSMPAADSKPWIEDVRGQKTGFMILDESDERDVVFGLALRTRSSGMPDMLRCSPAEFRTLTGPGTVRVVFDLRVVDEGPGVVRVSTETRILGDDPATRRDFARYWRFVYPGSAIIRRVWLDAMIDRAERVAEPRLTGTVRPTQI